MGMNSVPSCGYEEQRPDKQCRRGRDQDGLTAQRPLQRRQVGPFGQPDEEAFLVGVGLEQEIAECRNGHDRQQQGSDERDDVGKGQGQEHLALDPLEGDDRDKGQGDDELAEYGWLAHLEHGFQDRCELALAGPFFAEVALDVLDLDDGGVDDHADGDGQPPQGHEVGRDPEDAHQDEGKEGRERQGQDDDERPAEAAQKKIQDEDDEQGPDQKGFAHRADGPVDDLGAVIVGHDAQAVGQDARSVDLRHPPLDRPHDLAAVGAAEHHDHPADDFALSVLDGAALADGLADADFGDVPQQDRRALDRLQDDGADVLDRLQHADAADEVLPFAALQDVAADVEVVPAQRIADLAEGQVVGQELFRVHVHMVLLDVAAEGIDFVDAGDPLEQGGQRPVLDGPGPGQKIVHVLRRDRLRAFERVLVDLAHGRGNRPHGDLDVLRDLLARFDQALQDLLAGEIDIDAVGENDGDHGKPGFRYRADQAEPRQAAHGDLDRIGDEPFDLGRRHARSGRQHLDLDVGDIGEGVDGDVQGGPYPQGGQEQDPDDDQSPPAQRALDQPFKNAHARPPGCPCASRISAGSCPR